MERQNQLFESVFYTITGVTMKEKTVNRSPETTEAWILGSGLPALASAIYLVKNAKLPPQKVHILDPHPSLGDVVPPKGNPLQGYDQFGGCLPAPVGAALSELLAFVPSPNNPAQWQSVLDETRSSERDRNPLQKNREEILAVQKNGETKTISSRFSMRFCHRWRLARFLLKRERQMGKKRISDFFPDSFFQSSFWAIWSIQYGRFGFQPWHGAVEFKRAVNQYLHEFASLRVLSSLDITGYYQFEYLFMPIYLHLMDLGVDYQFNVWNRAINITQVDKQQRMVTKLNFMQNGFEQYRTLQRGDIVIATLGSTSSGSFVGADDRAPSLPQLDETQRLDENWSLWLELANKNTQFGNPYTFCTRSRESMLESFTITTEDLELFDQLSLSSSRGPVAGNMISLIESRWKLNICVPLQPVFSDQPCCQRVLWGYASSPLCEGNYVRKAMIYCTGSEILSELLTHLHIRSEQIRQRTVIIPRVMPRMTAHLLPHSPNDRLNITPNSVANIGIVGQFVDIPYYTTADISYGVRSAKIAVSRLMGLGDDDKDVKNKNRDWQITLSNISKIVL